jgi:hypothetical protein
MTISHVYDDDEDIATPGEALTEDEIAAIAIIRAVPDRRIRKALMAVFVIAVLNGRVGR